MERSYYRISLDIRDSYGACQLDMKRTDTHRQLIINLTDGGIPYHITQGCYAVFTAKKPDGTVIYNNCTVENDTIIYDITPQTTAAEGLLNCEIRLYDAQEELQTDANGVFLTGEGVQLLTSAAFRIRVHPTVYNESDTLASREEVSALNALIAQTQTAINTANATAQALLDAKEAGEFKGESGEKGEKGDKGDPGELSPLASQGRSVKYYVYTPGWKRILNLIRTSNGMLTLGVAKARSASGYSCQALGIDFACNVNFPSCDVKTQPVIYQRYNHEFGENNSNDTARRARITRVRIGYPKEGTQYPASDGAVNYKTNPVNCYLDVYVDFDPQFDGDRIQLNINYAGFVESHNCEPITEETDAADTGIYGEELEYGALALRKNCTMYLPGGRIDTQGVIATNLQAFTAILTELRATKIVAANMPFERLAGTNESPITLKNLSDGVYYITGKGNYYGTDTVSTLVTGIYMVRQFAAYTSVCVIQHTTVHNMRWLKITDTSKTETLIELDKIAAIEETVADLENRLASIESIVLE